MFLNRLGITVTETAMSELVQRKADNPRDLSIEKALKLWRAESNGKQDNRISQIIGIYHRNMARLSMTIHCSHGNKTTIPIKESVLRAIFNEQDEISQDTMLLQAFGAERYTTLNMIPLVNRTVIRIAQCPRNSRYVEMFALLGQEQQEHRVSGQKIAFSAPFWHKQNSHSLVDKGRLGRSHE
jgi:hypothetical protein